MRLSRRRHQLRTKVLGGNFVPLAREQVRLLPSKRARAVKPCWPPQPATAALLGSVAPAETAALVAERERCSAMSRACCSTPDAFAKRSSWRASTPTPILSAVSAIASAAEMERSTKAARPPTVVTPISAAPSVRIPVHSSSACRPRPFNPPEARSPEEAPRPVSRNRLFRANPSESLL